MKLYEFENDNFWNGVDYIDSLYNKELKHFSDKNSKIYDNNPENSVIKNIKSEQEKFTTEPKDGMTPGYVARELVKKRIGKKYDKRIDK